MRLDKIERLSSQDKKRLVELGKQFSPLERAFIFSSIHYLSYIEIGRIIKKPADIIERYVRAMGREHAIKRIREFFSAVKIRAWMEGDLPKFKKAPRKGITGKRNVTGVRPDLGIFVRSKLEANLARILTAKYGRDSWTYEEEAFDLTVGKKNKRIRRYTPDFHVVTDTEDFYIEVKGRFWSGDQMKMLAFKKQYPKKKVIFVTYDKSKKVRKFAARHDIDCWIIEQLKLEWAHKIEGWE